MLSALMLTLFLLFAQNLEKHLGANEHMRRVGSLLSPPGDDIYHFCEVSLSSYKHECALKIACVRAASAQ